MSGRAKIEEVQRKSTVVFSRRLEGLEGTRFARAIAEEL